MIDPIKQNTPVIHVIAALNCEVKCLVDAFRLKKTNDKPFPTYEGLTKIGDDKVNVCVLISGIGAIDMASAVGWLGARGISRNNIWLNVGIAGHSDFAVGTTFVVTSSRDLFSQKTFYPPQVAKRISESSGCLSVNAPSGEYPDNGGLDMEAAAFFRSAARFSATELVQSMKVVSDNPESSLEGLNAKVIGELMNGSVKEIVGFLESLLFLVRDMPDLPAPLLLPDIRATHSQKKQFDALSSKVCHVLNQSELNSLEQRLNRVSNVSEAIRMLEDILLKFTPKIGGG
ncbi:hypothetical protein [Arenicella sp. 4NH20-0111]|uniref:hypothetical protein n=1 Tax=Arenicella sp. 4NH20-0111 TaxID=3127648 RepID=UPI00333FEFB2